MLIRKNRSRSTPLWRRKFDAFVKNNEGVVAVEFALVAAPFFILLFGLIEIALIFLMSTTLDYGVSQASREIRTGALQARSGVKSEFEKLVCGNLLNLLDCGSRLHIDVKRYDDFVASVDGDGLPVDGDGNLINSFDFDPGGPNEIVLVQVYYEWGLITPVISAGLSNMGDGKRLLHATAVFRNEPF